MSCELFIQLHPGASGTAEEILADFPFDSGQSIVTFGNGAIVVSLGEADDTTCVQEWYLNNNEDIQSFYIVED